MNYGMYGLDDDGDFIYAGGPLIFMSDEESPMVPIRHDMDVSTNVCRKCRKPLSDITNDPYAECLLSIDFSEITKSLVGGR